MSSALAHGTEVGFTFSFIECRRIAVMSGVAPRDWLKTVAPAEGPHRQTMTSRWIYAFRFAGPGRATLFSEFYANDKGHLTAWTGDHRLKTEPGDCGPGFAFNGPLAALPITANGAPLTWMFVASRIRLACASLRALCRFELGPPTGDGFLFASSKGVTLPAVDLSNRKAFTDPVDGKHPALPIVDFLALAHGLRLDYERACNNHLRYTTPLDEFGQEQKSIILNRALKYTLARVVRMVIKNEPALGSEVDHLAVVNTVDDYEATIARLKTARELAARHLTSFLRSPPMTLAESWYREREEETYPQWLEELHQLHDRLEESVTGIACLNKPAPIVQHALTNYVFPIDNRRPADAKKAVSVFKKASAPVTGLWSKYMPWYLVNRAQEGPKKLLEAARAEAEEAVHWMNQLLGQEVLTLRTKLSPAEERLFDVRQMAAEVTQPDKMPLANRVVAKERAKVELNQKAHDALKETALSPSAKLTASVFTSLALGIDTINNGFKLAALAGKAPEQRKGWDYWDAGSGLNSAAKNLLFEKLSGSASKGLERFGSRAVRTAGVLGIIFDAGNAYKEYSEAAGDDDIASATASIASGVFAVGGGALTLLGLANPPLAVALLALQGAASVAAFLLRDSRIENFLQHCTFGSEFGASNATPTWAAGSYAEWAAAGGLEKQIETLFNLITTFRVKAYNPVTVDIHLGYYDEDMTVEAKYYDERTPKGQPSLVRFNILAGPFGPPHPSEPERRWQVMRLSGATGPSIYRVVFDRHWRFGQVWFSGCRIRIHRRSSLIEQHLDLSIPQSPTKLSSTETARYGGRPELVEAGLGLTYPICGAPRGQNPDFKSSSE